MKIGRVRASRPLFAALVGAQLAYPRVPAARQPAATRAIVGLALATSVADAIERLGPRRALRRAGLAGGIGFAAELLGVATGKPFGHYTYSGRLGPRVGGVPLLAAAAWTMMAEPAWAVATPALRGERNRTVRSLSAAGALTAWDVFLDPRMVRDGYWTWPGGGRYEGVPASNFAGWLLVGSAVFATFDDDDGDPAPLPVALYAWTWAGETIANLVFWKRPVVAAAGTVAMGAFALPALRR